MRRGVGWWPTVGSYTVAGSRGKGNSQKRSANGATSSHDVAPFLRVAADWKGYVNVELDQDVAGRFAAFCGDPSLVQEITAEVLYRGYKVSVVQVENERTVRATATAGFRGMPDAGLAVSAWQEDLFGAVAAVIYIVACVSQFDLSVHEKPAEQRLRRTF